MSSAQAAALLATMTDLDRFLHFSVELGAAVLFTLLVLYPIVRLFGGR